MLTLVCVAIGIFAVTVVLVIRDYDVMQNFEEKLYMNSFERDRIISCRISELDSMASLVFQKARPEKFDWLINRARTLFYSEENTELQAVLGCLQSAKEMLDSVGMPPHQIVYELFQNTWRTQEDRLSVLRREYAAIEQEYVQWQTVPFHRLVKKFLL